MLSSHLQRPSSRGLNATLSGLDTSPTLSADQQFTTKYYSNPVTAHASFAHLYKKSGVMSYRAPPPQWSMLSVASAVSPRLIAAHPRCRSPERGSTEYRSRVPEPRTSSSIVSLVLNTCKEVGRWLRDWRYLRVYEQQYGIRLGMLDMLLAMS